MSKKVLIDAFFNQFTGFINELKAMYPQDPDFPTFSTTLSLAKMTNPMMVVKFIKTDIVDKYGDKINSRDESFFMAHDYAKDGEVDVDIVEKLKQYISGMSSESKDIVWRYIEILCKLCIKILEI
jgi:hypothetical protein